jgi:fluoride exporter
MEFAITARRTPVLITPTNSNWHSGASQCPRFNSRWEKNSMQAVLWISLGAILGANARYFLSRWIARTLSPNFPYGTMIINITGSFILAFFLVWTTERVLADPRWRHFLAIGFCGAYTTFSSYAFETMAYFQQGQWLQFGLNVLLSNLFCLAAVLAGGALARAL